MTARPRAGSWTLSLVAAGAAAACSGGGGGGPKVLTESEPNDTPAQADALALDRPARGSLAAPGDVDCFSVPLTAGRFVRVEVHATRFDQESWDAGGTVPRVLLVAPDGTSKRLEHDFGGLVSNGWGWGAHDLDFPLHRIPSNGHYTVCVTQADDSLPGGEYALVVSQIVLPGLQQEFEPRGTIGANDTPNTSQVLAPGSLHGFHADLDEDYYAVTVLAPSILRFEVHSYREGVHDGDDGYFDPQLILYDVDGTTLIAFDDDTFFFDPGIQFVIVSPGTYFLEVEQCCGSGDADYLLTYALAAYSGASESEPNDVPASADPIAYGDQVHGTIDVGETDLYAFSGTAGDMVRLEVFDGFNVQLLSQTLLVELLGPDGATVKASGGNLDLRTLTTILDSTATYYARVTPVGSQTAYALRLSRWRASAFESEPNDTPATADPLGDRAAGAIDAPGDVDVFAFTAFGARLVTVAAYASDTAVASDGMADFSGHGSDLAPLLTITDAAGAVLATSTSVPAFAFTESVVDPLPTAAVSFLVPSTGTYHVRVESALGQGGPEHSYVVEKR